MVMDRLTGPIDDLLVVASLTRLPVARMQIDYQPTHPASDGAETIVCRCLKVTEETVLDAIDSGEACTVREICRRTGAGGGCNACHAMLRHYLRTAAERVPVS